MGTFGNAAPKNVETIKATTPNIFNKNDFCLPTTILKENKMVENNDEFSPFEAGVSYLGKRSRE